MMKIKSIIAVFSLIFAGAIVLTGCGGTQATKEAAKPDQIVIGVQTIPSGEPVVKAQYEKEFGTKVIVKQFDSGRDVNTAMAAGSIDIAILGSAPASIGIAKGIPYEVFWIHDIEGDNEALAVKNEANVQTIQELKGRKIAAPAGSTAHYSLLNALKNAGVSASEVTILDMQPPEILAAWQRGDIDAAYVWQPTLAKLVSDGRILVTSRELAAKGIVTADVGIVRTDFARKYPDILKKYVALQGKAYQQFKDKPEEAAGIVAKDFAIDAAEALKEMKELIWLAPEEQQDVKYLGTTENKGQFGQTLKDTADFLAEQKAIDHAPDLETFNKAVNPSFLGKE